MLKLESGDELSVKNILMRDINKRGIIKVLKNSFLRILREVFHMFFYLILIFLSSYIIIHFIGQRTEVIGHSMENTLFDHDSLIIDKLSYHFISPKRFDIIVFPVDNSDDVYYIKRIIGMPGEAIQIIDGDIYINDEILDESYGKEEIASNNTGLAEEPIILQTGQYFVLGDNRNHSTDSRDPDVGIIGKTSIVGKAWLRVWPSDRFGYLKHQ